ncbi:TIGR02588 family protein [soil metagenome]
MKKMQKNWLEWVVFALGLILVSSTLGYLIYAGASMGHEPPSIEVRLGTPEPGQFNFTVPVTIVNHGDETAEGVRIEVVVESRGEAKERAELDVAFLPRHATREGWVTFDQDPRASQLKARVLGYQKP